MHCNIMEWPNVIVNRESDSANDQRRGEKSYGGQEKPLPVAIEPVGAGKLDGGARARAPRKTEEE